MKQITTESGFVAEIEESSSNDMELLDLFVDLDDEEDAGNQMLIASKIARKLLGQTGRKKLYDFIRKEDGTVPIDKFMEIFQEIIIGMGENKKKSSPSPE